MVLIHGHSVALISRRFCGSVPILERFWFWLRSWLRPHRGISQEKLPLYLGFFKFVHNTRIRGKSLLKPLLELLLR